MADIGSTVTIKYGKSEDSKLYGNGYIQYMIVKVYQLEYSVQRLLSEN